MCFYDQKVYPCGNWRWGNFRQHCSQEYRTGETCGMKLVWKTEQIDEMCKICQNIGAKFRRQLQELRRIHRWQRAHLLQEQLEQRLQQEEQKHYWQRGPGFHDKEWEPELRVGGLHTESMTESLKEIQRLDISIKEDLEEARVQGIHFDFKVLRSITLSVDMAEIDQILEEKLALAIVPLPQHKTNILRPMPILSTTTPVRLMSLIPKLDARDSKLSIPERFKANQDQSHPAIDLACQQIRLLELTSTIAALNIEGKFHCVLLSVCPTYTALSYTWGDPGKSRAIQVGGKRLAIPENLWWFLYLYKTSELEEPPLFWIDAICIDQANVLERNHQVGLMKQIYTKAANVVVWLGREADHSDLAMSFVAKKGSAPLKPKGDGFRRMWTRDEGKALVALCQRPYWRRIWIIQEIIHARQITVWCGKMSFAWNTLENLYAKLRTLELTRWIAHHECSGEVLYSFASVTVWQRAHWRHPDTPTPSLRKLLEVFQDWQCTDARDMVFGLLGMVDQDGGIAVDYAKSTEKIYDEVRTLEWGPITDELEVGNDYLHFCRLLRRGLKLAEYR